MSGLCDLELSEPRATRRALIARAYDDVRARTLAEDGLYRHAQKADARVYLLDQVAMAEAELALAQCSDAARHRDALLALLAASERLFDKSKSQYLSTSGGRAPFRENARLARVVLRAALLTGVEGARQRALRERGRVLVGALGDPARVAGEGRAIGPFILAANDLGEEPVHIAVVGRKSRDLFEAAAQIGLPSRIVEHLETSARFPDLGKPAAFVCSSTRCSRPIFDGKKLKPEIARFLAPEP